MVDVDRRTVTTGGRLAASSWDQLQILPILCLTMQCWGRESFPRGRCPSRTISSAFSSLETQWGKGWGAPRGEELQGVRSSKGWGAPRGSHTCQLEPLQSPGLLLPEKWRQEKDLTSWFFSPRSFVEPAEQLSALSKLSSLQLTVEPLGVALLTRQ